jgi:multiple sugar transport system permease protein
MMIGFYRGVPRELEEAAMIDGCNRFTALFRVILPTVLPGIVATAIFAFIDAWNAFLVPFVLINDDNHWPLTVGLNRLLSEYEILWSGISAGSVLALIPAFIFFAYIQKYLIRGLAGAVKG